MSGECIFELQNISGTVICHGNNACSSLERNELDQTGRGAIQNTKKHAGRRLKGAAALMEGRGNTILWRNKIWGIHYYVVLRLAFRSTNSGF